MVQSTFQRTGVAILLIVTLLLPFETCRPADRPANHDCCGQHSEPVAGVKANCCIVHSELPAIVAERATISHVLLANIATIHPSLAPAIPREAPAARTA